MRIIFLDTSAIVAAINRRDQHHFKAKQVLAELAKGQCKRGYSDAQSGPFRNHVLASYGMSR